MSVGVVNIQQVVRLRVSFSRDVCSSRTRPEPQFPFLVRGLQLHGYQSRSQASFRIPAASHSFAVLYWLSNDQSGR